MSMGIFLAYGQSKYAASYIDALVQDCSISSALAMEILQSCTKPSICDCGIRGLI